MSALFIKSIDHGPAMERGLFVESGVSAVVAVAVGKLLAAE